MDTIGVPTDPSNHIINGTGPLTKMLEMGTEPIDVIGGWADLIVTQRAMGRFFSSVSRCTQTTRQDSRFMTGDVLRRLMDRFDERRGNNETRLSCHLHLSQFSRRSIRQCVRRLCARRVHHKGGQDVSHDTKDQVTRPELSNRQRSLDKVVRRDLIRGVLSFQGTLWCFDRHLVKATSKF